MKVGNGWNIEYNPVGASRHNVNWMYWHDDTDGENALGGNEGSKAACLEAIKDFELEHPYFNEEK
jgi:hypothetical protein